MHSVPPDPAAAPPSSRPSDKMNPSPPSIPAPLLPKSAKNLTVDVAEYFTVQVDNASKPLKSPNYPSPPSSASPIVALDSSSTTNSASEGPLHPSASYNQPQPSIQEASTTAGQELRKRKRSSDSDDSDDPDTTSQRNKSRKSQNESTSGDEEINSEENSPEGTGPTNVKGLYECEICQQTFTRHRNLKSHYLIHTGVKPHVCTECGQAFSRQHDLKRHQRLHTGAKPYKCEFCDRSFARSDSLKRHLKSDKGACPGLLGQAQAQSESKSEHSTTNASHGDKVEKERQRSLTVSSVSSGYQQFQHSQSHRNPSEVEQRRDRYSQGGLVELNPNSHSFSDTRSFRVGRSNMSPVEPPLPSPLLNSAEPYHEDLQRPGHTFPPMAHPSHQYKGNRNLVHSTSVEDGPLYRRYSDPYRLHSTHTDKTRPPYNAERAPQQSLNHPQSMGKPQNPRNFPGPNRQPPHSALRGNVSSFATSDSEYHSHDSYDSSTYDSGYSSHEYRRRNPRPPMAGKYELERLDREKYARDRVIQGRHNGESHGETDFGRNESTNVNLNSRTESTDVFVKPTSFRSQFSKPRSSSSPAPIHSDLSAPLPLPPSPLNSGHPRLPPSYPVQSIRHHPSQPLLSPPLVDSPGEMANGNSSKKVEVNGNIDISDFTPRERFLFSQNELLFERMTALENAVVGVFNELKRNETMENKLQGLENQVKSLRHQLLAQSGVHTGPDHASHPLPESDV